MAEGAGLLNQYTGNRIEGSNPSLSAIAFFAFSFKCLLWQKSEKCNGFVSLLLLHHRYL